MKKKRILTVLILIIYSLIMLGVVWTALYFLINRIPAIKSPEEVAHITPTASPVNGTVVPTEVVSDEPAPCHPNCSLAELNKSLDSVRQVTKYSVDITLGFDCVSEYHRDYYGNDYEEVLVKSECNPDQVGQKVRVVGGVRYEQIATDKWEKKNSNDVDYFTLGQILPPSPFSDKQSSYQNQDKQKVYYQDSLNKGFNLISFGYGQPDYEYYVFRKEGSDARCVTESYDPFIQGSPKKAGDLDPTTCGNYVWYFSKGLRFLEYRTVGFEVKIVLHFSNFGNTKPVSKPI